MLKIRTRAEAKLPPKLALTWDREPDAHEPAEQEALDQQGMETAAVKSDLSAHEAASEPVSVQEAPVSEKAAVAVQEALETEVMETEAPIPSATSEQHEDTADTEEEPSSSESRHEAQPVVEEAGVPDEAPQPEVLKADQMAEAKPEEVSKVKPAMPLPERTAVEPVAKLPAEETFVMEKVDMDDEAEETPEPSAEPPEVIQMSDQETVAEILDRMRCDAGVTLRDVSAKTQIPQAFLVDFKERRFENLPDLDTCLSRIGRLCQEFGADKQPILDKFTLEYKAFIKEHSDVASEGHTNGRPLAVNRPGGFDIPNVRWMTSMPSLIILGFIFMLVGILVYAVFSYFSKVPEKIEADMTEFVRPIKVVVPDMDHKRL